MDIVFVTNSLNVFSAGLFTLVLILAAASLVLIKKNEIYINTEKCEYENLINRLSEIRSIIALLEENYINKL